MNLPALGLIAAASVMNASFALPMKLMRKWSWQSSWLLWSVLALLLLPVLAVIATVPHAAILYRDSSRLLLFRVISLGAGWGIAQVLFGLAIESAGIAVTFSLVLGTSACLGGILPLVLFPERGNINFFALGGGVAAMASGLAMCAYAGSRRDLKKLIAASQVGKRSSSRLNGVLFALLSGVCASSMSFGLLAAVPLSRAAAGAGASPYFATNLAWLPLLAGGAVPNILYCLFLMRRAGTAGELFHAGIAHCYLLSGTMAVLWFGSSIVYGAATQMLGKSGLALGWPVYMSMIVIVAGVIGFGTGEWRGAGLREKTWQLAGMMMLILGVFTMTKI